FSWIQAILLIGAGALLHYGERKWHERFILSTTTPSSDLRSIGYCVVATPDGDIYGESLAAPNVQGLALLGEDRAAPPGLARRNIYRFEDGNIGHAPDATEIAHMRGAALQEQADLQKEIDDHGVGVAAPHVVASTPAPTAATAPIGPVLAPAAGFVWVVAATEGVRARGSLVPLNQVVGGYQAGTKGVAGLADGSVIFAELIPAHELQAYATAVTTPPTATVVPPPGGGAIGVGMADDARTLAVRYGTDGKRRREVRDGVELASESPWGDWPIKGPRTARWVGQYFVTNGGGPLTMHNTWKVNCKLQPSDNGVLEHEALCKMLELAIEYDQLNIGELASIELACRRLQMIQYRWRERILGSVSSGTVDDESHFFLGVDPTRGNLCICPALNSWLGEELHKESQANKEQRKAREAASLARLERMYKAVGPPPQSRPEEALEALLGGMTLYSQDTDCTIASFDETLVSWPSPGSCPVNVAERLDPETSHLLSLAGMPALLAEEGSAPEEEVVKPYMDPALASSPNSLGRFYGRLHQSHMLTFVSGRHAHTVGVFFVHKKSGKLRLILDTRAANRWLFLLIFVVSSGCKGEDYITPEYATLPMGWSWSLFFCQHVLQSAAAQAGLPETDCIEDRSWIGQVSEGRAIHAEYVDNFFVCGIDREFVQQSFDRLRGILESWGFAIHEVTEAQPIVEGLGLRFDGAERRVTLTSQRVWKLRLSAIALGRLRGPPPPKWIEKIVGHFTFAMMVRREALSVFSSVYKYIRASPCEQWRYSVEGAIKARANALGLKPEEHLPADLQQECARVCSSEFKEIPAGVLSFEAWHTVFSGAWDYHENILRTEGRAMISGIRHKLRAVRSQQRPRPIMEVRVLRPPAAKAQPRPCKIRRIDPAVPDVPAILAGATSALEMGKLRRTTTQDRYSKVLLAFYQWVQFYQSLTSDWDALLTGYLNELYVLNQNVSAAEYVFAAFKFKHPQFGKHGSLTLPRATQALEGFRNLAPPQMRLPTPWVAFIAVVGLLLAHGEVLMAIALLIQWDLLLRPGELIGLQPQHMVPPMPTANMPSWGVILAPSEESNTPSKANVFDESVTLSQQVEFILPALEALVATRAKFGPLFPFTGVQLGRKFKEAADYLNLHELNLTLHGNRHGGASDLRLRGTPLKEIKKRGRWAADSSLRRYEKATLAQQQIHKVPLATRLYGAFVEQQLPRSARLLQLAVTCPAGSSLEQL
ncbi:unnamed protein product, partial [Symbiodinium necroappetens]